jgi:hypothetical protein
MNRLTWLSDWSADVVRDMLSDAAPGRLNWVRGLLQPCGRPYGGEASDQRVVEHERTC